MSAKRRAKSIPGSGVAGKEVVMGVLRRGNENEPSKATAAHIPNRKKAQVHAAVKAAAEPGSFLYTDSLMSYAGLSAEYVHGVVGYRSRSEPKRVATRFWEVNASISPKRLRPTSKRCCHAASFQGTKDLEQKTALR